MRNYNSNSNDKRKIHVRYRCQELGHYANECLNLRKSQDYVPLCGNCKTAGHPTDESPKPKKYYQSNDKDWNKGKHVHIQEDGEGRSRNVNHIQHIIYSHSSYPESRVNAVTTRSKRIVEPLPVPDDNSDDKSLEYDSPVNPDPNKSNTQDPFVPGNSQRGHVPTPVVPTTTVVQPVPVIIPIHQPQPVTVRHINRPTKLPTTVTQINQASVRMPNYSVLTPGNINRKSSSKRT
jgi:hypothetical protein